MSKYKTIANTLRTQIRNGTFTDSGKLPTEQMLCEAYQASRQTVRHSLAILEKEGLIEKLQGSGSRIVDPRRPVSMPPRAIAVITTYISDYIFPSILREIEDVLSRNNCTPMLYATKNQVVNERAVLQSLLAASKLDGILVEGTKTALPNPNLDLYGKLLERSIPIVFLNGNYQEFSGALSVLDDNYGGGYKLVRYLYEKGHKRIAGIFKSDDIQGHQRYAGYAAALLDFGLTIEDSHLFWYNTEAKDFLAGGMPFYADQMLAVLEGCTAVVCYNDEIASILLMSLLKRGTNVPEEMALVSFDNSRYSEIGPMQITSLSHGENNVGRLAAQMLVKLLHGEKCVSQFSPWELIERESS